MKTLLQLSGIRKSFGLVRALKGVSFALVEGEVHALLGENGAGKSTLIKVISGAHRPDAGKIEFGGEEISDLTPAKAHALGIACIYQQPALFPDLSVAENIGLRLEKSGMAGCVRWKQWRKNAQKILSRLGADISPDTEAGSLSMPQQQLVEKLRRHGIHPYRYRGQRRTTVMARLSRAFVNETLWPEFQELQSTLAAYFDALTDRVIEQALEVRAGEAEEQAIAAPALAPHDHQGSLL